MSLLLDHMAAVEDQLLATARIPANTGHPLHKGTPREAFVREFLEHHLPSTLAIGTGELVDHASTAHDPRRQHDIVVFKRTFPKLNFGGGVSGFLAESVLATIEVKSVLDKAALRQAMTAGQATKALTKSQIRSFEAGYVPPATLSLVVAYAGPAQMGTVLEWLGELELELGLPRDPLPLGPERTSVASPSVDGVFVLGKGFVTFDNFPTGFLNDSVRAQVPDTRWFAATAQHGALMWLFHMLTQASMHVSGTFLDMTAYLRAMRVEFRTG